MTELHSRTHVLNTPVVDVEQLATDVSNSIRNDRKHHTDWNHVNELLFTRVPKKRCGYERLLFGMVGGMHVIVKLLLLMWVFYSILTHVIYTLDSAFSALTHLIALLGLYVMIAYNYFKCITLDNAIPDCWVAPSELCDGGRCVFCKRTRPLRSHHCVACGCCQLRRDHHCYWIANCIGVFNYPYFVSLTLYDFLLASYTFTVTYEAAQNALLLGDQDHPFNFLFLCGIAIVISPMLCAYFVAHMYLTLTGRTSHECVSGYGKFHSNPFDNGWKRNWQAVFGPHPFAILFPFLTPTPNKNFFYELNTNAASYYIETESSTPLSSPATTNSPVYAAQMTTGADSAVLDKLV